jgi:hypothetical protein
MVKKKMQGIVKNIFARGFGRSISVFRAGSEWKNGVFAGRSSQKGGVRNIRAILEGSLFSLVF